MTALTICQPFADLVLLPSTDPRYKRTENRTWLSSFRGPLLIHAGKSRQWLAAERGDAVDREFGLPLADMVFGAILGIVTVIDWLPAGQVEAKYRQLRGHRHIEGPMCVVMHSVRRFASPVPFKGAQGLFPVPDAVGAEQMRLLEPAAAGAAVVIGHNPGPSYVVSVRGRRPPELLADPSFVYVGRAMPRQGWAASPWGNPFRPGMTLADATSVMDAIPPGDRTSSWADRPHATAGLCDWYGVYLRARASLTGRLHELRGKVLGCWCGDWRPGEPDIGCHAVKLAEASAAAGVAEAGR